MKIKVIDKAFTICKISEISSLDLKSEFCFIGKTDEEISLVCLTEDVPCQATEREHGWRGFRIEGVLDFSLVGILAKISKILADCKIGIFAVSTFNTDYIFTKEKDFISAIDALKKQGYIII